MTTNNDLIVLQNMYLFNSLEIYVNFVKNFIKIKIKENCFINMKFFDTSLVKK